MPQLTGDERKAFGPYAGQYAIITTFHEVLNDTVSPRLAAAMSRRARSKVGRASWCRAGTTCKTAKASIDAIAAALDVTTWPSADAAHRGLHQPDVREGSPTTKPTTAS